MSCAKPSLIAKEGVPQLPVFPPEALLTPCYPVVSTNIGPYAVTRPKTVRRPVEGEELVWEYLRREVCHHDSYKVGRHMYVNLICMYYFEKSCECPE